MNIILMDESLEAISLLEDEDAGALIKGLIRHINGEDPGDLPRQAALVFPFVRGQVERMLAIHEKRAEAGRKGGEANRKQSGSKVEANAEQSGSPIPIPKPIPKPINTYADKGMENAMKEIWLNDYRKRHAGGQG